MTELQYAEGVVFRREPAGGILFNVDTGDLQVAEGVAFGICDMIDHGAERDDILTELKKNYPDQDNIEQDLDHFLDELRSRGALA